MKNQYEFILSVVKDSLTSATAILEKGKQFAKEKGIEESVLLQAQLASDQFNFTKQIQIVSDNAKTNLSKLAGKVAPKMEDTESTFDELLARIKKTADYVATFTAADFADADTARVSLYWMGTKYVEGVEFAEKFALQNLYFHLVTAYSILRNQGVQLGKMDYILNLNMKESA